jgi:hypothetical protein
VRRYHLFPVIPVLALVLMPFLPFVNTTQLWFGLPRMLVWGALSCVVLSVCLFFTDREMAREAGEDDQ